MIMMPDPLDRDFPLGDGVADLETTACCPHCGEIVEMAVDPGGGSVQEYVEDCPVCCRPCAVTLLYDCEGRANLVLRAESAG